MINLNIPQAYAHSSATETTDAAVMVESLNPHRRYVYEAQDLLGIHKCLGAA